MNLSGKRIALLIEQQYQEMEVWYPVYRLKEAGAAVTLVGLASNCAIITVFLAHPGRYCIIF